MNPVEFAPVLTPVLGTNTGDYGEGSHANQRHHRALRVPYHS